MEQNDYMSIRTTKELKKALKSYADRMRWKQCNAVRVILEQFLFKKKG